MAACSVPVPLSSFTYFLLSRFGFSTLTVKDCVALLNESSHFQFWVKLANITLIGRILKTLLTSMARTDVLVRFGVRLILKINDMSAPIRIFRYISCQIMATVEPGIISYSRMPNLFKVFCSRLISSAGWNESEIMSYDNIKERQQPKFWHD